MLPVRDRAGTGMHSAFACVLLLSTLSTGCDEANKSPRLPRSSDTSPGTAVPAEGGNSHRAATPDAASLGAPVRLAGNEIVVADTLLTVTSQTPHAVVSLRGYLKGEGKYQHRIVDAQRKQRRIYILLQSQGLSRPDAPGGMCGGGDETVLIWLNLNPEGRVASSKSSLTESCLEDVNPLGVSFPDFVGDVWEYAYTTSRGPARRIVYDRTLPERGFSIVQVRQPHSSLP